jgi:hypothetical protein
VKKKTMIIVILAIMIALYMIPMNTGLAEESYDYTKIRQTADIIYPESINYGNMYLFTWKWQNIEYKKYGIVGVGIDNGTWVQKSGASDWDGLYRTNISTGVQYEVGYYYLKDDGITSTYTNGIHTQKGSTITWQLVMTRDEWESGQYPTGLPFDMPNEPSLPYYIMYQDANMQYFLQSFQNVPNFSVFENPQFNTADYTNQEFEITWSGYGQSLTKRSSGGVWEDIGSSMIF